MGADAADLSLVDVLPLLHRRELSARELVDACLARVEADDPSVRAFVTLTPDRAQAAATRADEDRAAGRPAGPLAGVPVAVKDLYLTRGTPTSAGSRVLAGHDPGVDAAVWERLAAAGAGLLGKTSTHEFGYGTASAPTRNPWDLTRTSGGSSGGSAATLAARMVPVALGSDTGGSLRIPAAACGVSTLRAAHGRVSTYGLLPLAPSLDVAGPLARRMLDVALLMRVLAGPDPRDPLTRYEPAPAYPWAAPQDLAGVRLGVPVDPFWSGIDASVADVCRAGVQVLVDRGAELVDVAVPASATSVLDAPFVVETVLGAQARHTHRDLLRCRERYTPQVLRRVLEGDGISADAYLRARHLCQVWAQDWRRVFADHTLTAVALPTLDQPPPVVEPDEEPLGPSTRLCMPWSLTGFPALSVPAGLDARGLPVGLGLAGLPDQEPALARLGVVVDEEVGLWRVPPVRPDELGQPAATGRPRSATRRTASAPRTPPIR